jgi:protoporphyrinogen oxidase
MLKKTIIVGGGISGLSFSYELLNKFQNVILVEKENYIGGLSRSVIINDCYVDMGAHLFYADDKEVYEKIREIVASKYWVKIKRAGKLFLKKKFINWPFNFMSVFQLSFSLMFEIFFGILTNVLKKKNKKINNYDDVIINIYGERIHSIFFKPLTEKFLKISSTQISPDWAIASLRAATKIKDSKYLETNKYLTNIDDNLKKSDFSLLKFFFNTVFKDKVIEPFFYFTEGYGTICSNYERAILLKKGIIKKNSQITKINIKNNLIDSVEINGEVHNVKNLIWSGSINSLCDLLSLDRPKLNYMHSLFCYIFLKKKFKKNFDCCYFVDRDISYQRATINSEYSSQVIGNPLVKAVGCFELSFTSIEQLKKFQDNHQSKIIDDCLRIGLFKKDDLFDVKFLPAFFSYPVFDLNYKNELDAFKSKIEKFKNIFLVGRQGSFSYENLDLIIRETLDHPLIRSA